MTQLLIRLFTCRVKIIDLQIPPCFNLCLVMNKFLAAPIVILPRYRLHITIPTTNVVMFGYINLI